METRSQDSASAYVRNGLGAGLAVIHTDLCNSELRVLPLSGLPIRLFSRGKLGEIGQQFVDDLTVRAT